MTAGSSRVLALFALLLPWALGVSSCAEPGGATYTAEPRALLFTHDFEGGDLSGFYWSGNAPEVVAGPNPVRAGTHSMRSYVHRYESPSPYRTEVHLARNRNMPPNKKVEAFFMGIGQEYWIGFSIYLPQDWVIDIEGLDDIVMQIQALPDAGESYRSPILGLRIDGDKWRMVSMWDSRAQSPPDNEFEGRADLLQIPLASSIGSWTDWVLNVRWSYQADGFIRVWENGQLVATRSGPNCSNDKVGPFFQMGLYKWPWSADYPSNTTWREIYHDELRVGDAGASYEAVAPPGGNPMRMMFSGFLLCATEEALCRSSMGSLCPN